MNDWIMLFSFSGREAASLYTRYKDRSVMVLTNRAGRVPFPTYVSYTKPESINKVLERVSRRTLVTLHGYNRILPSSVLNNPHLDILNVHPGDVILYPQLVGLHPQRKALELGLKSTGVIIHRVSSDLDRGEILARSVLDIDENETEQSLVHRLRVSAYNLWLAVLEDYFNERRRRQTLGSYR